MRTIINIGIWVILAAWFIGIMGFVSGQMHQVICNRIQINLSDTDLVRFVTEEEIRDQLESSDFNLQGYPLSEINTRQLEQELERNPFIRNAEVSAEISGALEIDIDQRNPIIRIMPEGHDGFYLDDEGYLLPLKAQFAPLLTIASGNIPYPSPVHPANVADENMEPYQTLREMYEFARFLSGNSFWEDQVVQVYVNGDGEFELIPRVGAHHILLGSMTGFRDKLDNLELLYRQGLSKYGWNHYEQINLKYENQIICTKR